MHRFEILTPGAYLTLIPADLARKHARCTNDADEALFKNIYIPTGIKRCEEYARRTLATATLKLTLPCFPWQSRMPIRLPRPPLISIISIAYKDEDGADQTLGASSYQLDTQSEPVAIYPAIDEGWPDTQRGNMNAVAITYQAGYGLDSDDNTTCPSDYIAACLISITDLYQTAGASTELPQACKSLLGFPIQVIDAGP